MTYEFSTKERNFHSKNLISFIQRTKKITKQRSERKKFYWKSNEIITPKITVNLVFPFILPSFASCSERWSNFLEIYNLWIKSLLNDWYITSSFKERWDFKNVIKNFEKTRRLISPDNFHHHFRPAMMHKYSPAAKCWISNRYSTCSWIDHHR